MMLYVRVANGEGSTYDGRSTEAVRGATAIVSTKNRLNRLKERHSCVAAETSTDHIRLTPTSQKLQKKLLFVIIPAVESSGGDSLTSPDAGSENTPSQGFETMVLSPL